MRVKLLSLVKKRSKTPPLRQQAYHAITAFFVFLGIVALTQGPFRASILEWGDSGPSIEVMIEHTGPATVTLAVSSRGDLGIMEWKNETQSGVFLSVPVEWKRREVRGATLEEVTNTDAGLGFVRWTLPSSATISLSVPSSVPRLVVRHEDATPLKVKWTRVDVDTGEVMRDIVLLQRDSAELW